MNLTVLALTSALLAQPPWISKALWDRDTIPTPGPVVWTEQSPGFETAELDATLGAERVDRVLLVRVDPARHRFVVRHAPEAPVPVEVWQEKLGALAVVNGSFYLMNNQPETPVMSAGKRLGPAGYASRHGAFVAGESASVLDLKGKAVDPAISRFSDAMVSYPLLLDEQGVVRAQGKPTWLANRTFVAVDKKGRVLLGTTETGFFALTRFGHFLKAAPLDLKIALNLDGGPVACQAVKAGNFDRVFYGQWEGNDSAGRFQMFWGFGEEQRWPLPIVLAVLPR